MLHDNYKLTNKISPLFKQHVPSIVQDQYPVFMEFMQKYFEFLETGELQLSVSFGVISQETKTSNALILEDGNYIIEEYSNVFLKGETVKGVTSNASAEVLVDDTIRGSRIFISANQGFLLGEEIVGSVSGSRAIVSNYRANPVQNIQQLLQYVDVDDTTDLFLKRFRDSYLNILPDQLAEGLDKRLLVKNIKQLYEAKGTKRAHEFFFRVLFGEDATILYPRDQIIKPSDGNWIKNNVIRLTSVGNSKSNEIIGQQITGKISKATAIIETVVNVIEAGQSIIEATVNPNYIKGTFQIDEQVTAISPITDLTVTYKVKGIVTGSNITKGGSNYRIKDDVGISFAGNGFAKLQISEIGSGSVDSYIVDSGGTGYQVGDSIEFNEDDTNGSGVKAKVQVVGGSFLMEDPFSLYTGDGIEVEYKLSRESTKYNTEVYIDGALIASSDYTITNSDIFFNTAPGNGSVIKIVYTDPEYLKIESGSEQYYQDTYTGTDIVLEEWTFEPWGGVSPNWTPNEESTSITKIRSIKSGTGYTKTPVVSDITRVINGTLLSVGSGSKIIPISSSIGRVQESDVVNFGLNYTSSPTLFFYKIFTITGASSTFDKGTILTSHDGVVVNHDIDRGILIIDSQDSFTVGDTITNISNVSATIAIDNTAAGNASVGFVGQRSGKYTKEDSQPSNSSNVIQDNNYYQDFSYVVKVNQSVDKWRDLLRSSIHPAGWNLFGELSSSSFVSAKIKAVTGQDVPDYVGDDTYTPELASVFDIVLHKIFPMRLGTYSDGSTLNTDSPFYSTLEDVPSGKRETTVRRYNVIKIHGRKDEPVYSGPTLATIIQNSFSRGLTSEPASNYLGITRPAGSMQDVYGAYGFRQFGDYNINDFAEEGTGRIPKKAYNTKVKYVMPSRISVTRTREYTFDSTQSTFDDGFVRWDKGS